MTSIYIKNADFSAGPVGNYQMPVSGAILSAWVGDADPDVATRNLVTGATMPVTGLVPVSSAGFRNMTTTNYLTSDVKRVAGNMTLMAVLSRTVSSNWGLCLSTEHNVTSPGRAGLTLGAVASEQASSMTVFASDTGTPYISKNSNDTLVARCIFGTTTLSGSTTIVQAFSATEGTSATTQSGTSTALQWTSAENAFPFLIGANYRGTVTNTDIAYVAIWPRVLSLAEQAVAYNSVKKRMTALGVVV